MGGTTMDLATMRDISLLWLILLGLITILPITVIFYYLIRGMTRLRQLALEYLPIAQEKTRFVAVKTEEISQKVASPIISVQTKAAQVNGVTRAAFSRRKSS
jgi:hypothetical protein